LGNFCWFELSHNFPITAKSKYIRKLLTKKKKINKKQTHKAIMNENRMNQDAAIDT